MVATYLLLFCPNEELAGGRSEVCMPVVTAIECDDLNVYSSRSQALFVSGNLIRRVPFVLLSMADQNSMTFDV